MKLNSYKCGHSKCLCIIAILLQICFAPLAEANGGRKTINFSLTKYSHERDTVRKLLKEDILEAESLPDAQKVQIRIAMEDLNDDKRPDMLVYVEQYPYFCGSAGCNFYVFISDSHGHWQPALTNVITHDNVKVLVQTTKGYKDILLENSKIWSWNGRKYNLKTKH